MDRCDLESNLLAKYRELHRKYKYGLEIANFYFRLLVALLNS